MVLEYVGPVSNEVVGRGGVADKGKEGDGITPIGTFRLGHVRYRADRGDPPATLGMAVIPIQPTDGWCDDPADAEHYNRPVNLPHPTSTESLHLDSPVYDILVEIEYNTTPVVPGRGSAIFLHVASDDFGPTAGCVGLRREHLLAVLAGCDKETLITIRRGKERGADVASSL